MSQLSRQEIIKMLSSLLLADDPIGSITEDADKDALASDVFKLLAEHAGMDVITQPAAIRGHIDVSPNLKDPKNMALLDALLSKSATIIKTDMVNVSEDKNEPETKTLLEDRHILNITQNTDVDNGPFYLSMYPSYLDPENRIGEGHDPGFYNNCALDGLHMRVELNNGEPVVHLGRTEDPTLMIKIPKYKTGIEIYDIASKDDQTPDITYDAETDIVKINRMQILSGIIQNEYFPQGIVVEDWEHDEDFGDDALSLTIYFQHPNPDEPTVKGALNVFFMPESAMIESYEFDLDNINHLIEEYESDQLDGPKISP